MSFQIKLYADGADLAEIELLRKNPKVSGFTTNPTLLSKSGITDYEKFAKDAASMVYPYPISFEVITDDLEEMYIQAKILHSWGTNIFVKIPVTNTGGVFTGGIISRLANEGIPINVTAVFTLNQVEDICLNLNPQTPSVVSIFAGRIADTGIDPLPIMSEALKITQKVNQCELLWASPREILNLIQAESVGCQIITMTTDLWKKVDSLGKNLNEFSIETVKMFYDDARKSNLAII